MRSKTPTAVLALILGVFGIHRFYLAQYIRGIIYLIYPIIILTALLLLTGSLDIIREQVSLDLTSELLIVLPVFMILPIIDAIGFFRIAEDKFDRKYNTNNDQAGKTILLSVFSILVAIGVNYFFIRQFYTDTKPKVEDSEAKFDLTAIELANAFSEDESMAQEKYGEDVIILSGIVVDEEFDPIFDERALILGGNDKMDIKCEFPKKNQEEIKAIAIGDEIRVKGYLREVLNDEILLNDCTLFTEDNR